MAPEGDLNAPDFVVELSRRESTRTWDVTGGIAVANPTYAHSHEQNRLLLTEPTPWTVAVADAERVQAEAGLEHRRIDWLRGAPLDVPDDPPDGWALSHDVVMELTGDLVGEPGDAQLLTYEQVRSALWTDWREHLPQVSDEVIEHLAGRRRATEKACDVTWHAVLLDGAVVSFCDLRIMAVRGELLAQIEDVVTLQAHRGHGYARNIVAHAVQAAREAGADRIWLVADRDDWPRELYSRMGFTLTGGGSVVAMRQL
ncbi:GNAT family N-acetyltransferase [Angustibacter sp. McL0619]|uniref:GNAT family N-acetyltransferase n=1 Tax=Angustibacter sp. McL0619 TaxID=3415676 RepID=UPI003CF6025C